MNFSYLRLFSFLRLLGGCLVLLFLSATIFACGDGDIVQKNFVCDKNEDCKSSQICQGGECVVADNDKDGFARNKDCNDNNRLVYPGAPERCDNGLDDNCDGQVDETPCLCKDGAVQACGLKVGECRQGQQTCKNGKWEECKGAVDPTPEVCDGKDNDCDGSIDEDVAQCCRPGDKRRCGSSVGECKIGTQRCDAGKWTSCEGDKRPTTEVCDGKDNDCDGKVDNIPGFTAPLQKPCYTGPPPTRSVGACREGLSFCRAGTWSKCEQEILPTQEICDGKDNDCNGKTDESFPDIGKDCSVNNLKGECAKSKYTCDKGQKKCEQVNKPVAELCNNKDDDCDGTIDNKKGDTTPMTRACYDGPAGTRKVGECKDGVQECIRGIWSSCKDQTKPFTEVCDGKDNDCDGKVDENFADLSKACTLGLGECKRTGKYVCRGDRLGVACDAKKITPGTDDPCDGKDNNCDGKVDEKFNDLGKECFSGQGICRRKGKRVCSRDGKSTTCDANPSAPELEKCDGKDNDCDGKVDENYADLGKSCSVGLGVCKRTGTQVCKQDGRGTTCNATAGAKSTEVCDGKDNDCDGAVDETFASLGKVCVVGKGECKKSGKFICKRDQLGVECNIQPGQAKAETCDGKDNDCDGSIDEDFRDKNKACTVGRGDCLRRGVYVCQANGRGLTCNATQGAPKGEVCDGRDNDCDGGVDEGASCPKGSACTNGACRKCSQPGDTSCPTFLGICTGDAPCPSCRCGLRCTTLSTSVFGRAAKRGCR